MTTWLSWRQEEDAMPAKSERQRRAAGADLQRVREGKRPRTFTGASEAAIEDYAHKPKGWYSKTKRKK